MFCSDNLSNYQAYLLWQWSARLEMISELSKVLGQPLYLFNCSSTMDSNMLGDIFRGLSSTGMYSESSYLLRSNTCTCKSWAPSSLTMPQSLINFSLRHYVVDNRVWCEDYIQINNRMQCSRHCTLLFEDSRDCGPNSVSYVLQVFPFEWLCPLADMLS